MPIVLAILRLAVFFLLVSPPQVSSPADVSRLEAEKNLGLAALEEGDAAQARARFEAVRKIAPGEPLGWADGAIAAMRAKDLAEAKKLLAEASRLAPADSRVLALEGTLRELEGDTAAAVEAFEKAAAANSRDLASRWSAARLAGQTPAGRERAIRDLNAALEQAPANLFLLTRLCENRREEKSRPAALAACDRMGRAIEPGDAKLEKYLGEARAALESGDDQSASIKYRVVENLLRATPRFQQARHDVEPGVVGLPIEEWSTGLTATLRARPRAIPVRFAEKPVPGLSGLQGLAAVRAAGKEGRDLVFASRKGLVTASARDGYRAGAPLAASASRAVEVADVTNSGELDIVTPGALWVRDKEAWRKTGIAAGDRVLPIDYDSDGDLDLYVSAGSGDRLLRNNLDGTWTDVTKTALPAGVSSRCRGGGGLRPRRRSGPRSRVGRRRAPAARQPARRPSRGEAGGPASTRQLPRRGRRRFERGRAAGPRLDHGEPRVRGVEPRRRHLPPGDGARRGRSAPPLRFRQRRPPGPLPRGLRRAPPSSATTARAPSRGSRGTFPPALDAEAVDFDGDGDLDLVLVTAGGGAALLENQGGNANGWLDVALEGLPTGSAKVNRFGYGSEVEIKSGQLYSLRTVSRPVTHLGLGANRKAEVLRVVWTNGIPQNLLSPPVRTLVREVQQLKGSCPFVYAYDGRAWRFVTDALGRSPAGLLYDGVHQAPADTREWLVIAGADAARPPAAGCRSISPRSCGRPRTSTSRSSPPWTIPPASSSSPTRRWSRPPFRKRPFSPSRVPSRRERRTRRGRDRTEEIARADGVYLAGFTPTRYQGIVAPHDLVLDLPRARLPGRSCST